MHDSADDTTVSLSPPHDTPPSPPMAVPPAVTVQPADDPPATLVQPMAPVTPATPAASVRRGSSVLGAALLAAVLSSILTLTGSVLIFRSLLPAATSSPAAGPASSPGIASAAGASALAAGAGDPAPDSASATVTAAARALPSVVTINTTSTGRRGGTLTSSGSGFVFDARGWILTNRHVVTGAQTVSVTLSDGRTIAGQVYGVSGTTDLAVIKVEATGLPAAQVGDSAHLSPGQVLLILGSPLGEYPNSVTTGVVSGLGRTIDVSGVERLTNLIQTDAAVNPGNSGGPMVDLGGRVIGVAVATSQAEGIAFGIPIEDARAAMAAALAGQPLP